VELQACAEGRSESNAPVSISLGSEPWVYENVTPPPCALWAGYQVVLPFGWPMPDPIARNG
jgi:hypothetical protein